MTAKSAKHVAGRRLRYAAAMIALVQVPVVVWAVRHLASDAGTLLALCLLLAWVNTGMAVHVAHLFPARPLSPWVRRFMVYPAVMWWLFCLILAVPVLAMMNVRGHGSSMPSPMAAVFVAGAVMAMYATLVRTRWVRLRRYRVALPRLPEGLDGFRIVHLSDLHVGNFFGASDLRRWARLVARADPDLVVITGDLVDGGDHALDVLCEGLRGLSAPFGVFACPGNHDALATHPDYWKRIQASGVTVLNNRGVEIAAMGTSFHLAGVDDLSQGRHDVARALAGWDARSFAVLLAHDPRLEQQAVAAGVDLVLFGHTHGGQLAVPFVPRCHLSARTYPHGGGVRRVRGSVVHVSRGLGTAGIPVRIGAAPEVVVLSLVRGAPGASDQNGVGANERPARRSVPEKIPDQHRRQGVDSRHQAAPATGAARPHGRARGRRQCGTGA